MTRQHIFDKLTDIIADIKEISPDTVHPQSRMIDDLGMDSLDLVALVMSIEEEFDLEIEDEEAERVATVDDVCQTIYLMTQEP